MTESPAKMLYCKLWEEGKCMKRVSSKGDDYCSDHTGMDEKHVDKTPAKERKIAIPGVAKSKETQKVEAPKLKPRSLLPSLKSAFGGGTTKSQAIDLTAAKNRSMAIDLTSDYSKSDFSKAMDLTQDKSPARPKAQPKKKTTWAPLRMRSKRILESDSDDEDRVIHNRAVPTYPVSASEIPDTPPEEHSEPKDPPKPLCQHKDLEWTVIQRALCLQCGGRGLGKSLDCYETCRKYRECEECKTPEENKEKMKLREREPKIKLICEGCKKNVLFLGSDGYCEQCDTKMTKVMDANKCQECKKIGETGADGLCVDCGFKPFLKSMEEGTTLELLKKGLPKIEPFCKGCKKKSNIMFLEPDGFCENCIKKGKGPERPTHKCSICGVSRDSIVTGICNECYIDETLKNAKPPAPGSFLDKALKDADRDKEIFKTSPARIHRPIKVKMTPTPEKSKMPFMSPEKLKRSAAQFLGWCSVCCNVYSFAHDHTECPATLSPGTALTAPVIDEFEDLAIPSPSKYYQHSVDDTEPTPTKLPELPSQGPCKEFQANKKSKVKNKCKCGFFKDEHTEKMDEDKGGKASIRLSVSKHFNHLLRLIDFTRADEPTPEEKKSPRTKTVKTKGKNLASKKALKQVKKVQPTEKGCEVCGSGKEFPKCRCVRMAADGNKKKRKKKRSDWQRPKKRVKKIE